MTAIEQQKKVHSWSEEKLGYKSAIVYALYFCVFDRIQNRIFSFTKKKKKTVKDRTRTQNWKYFVVENTKDIQIHIDTMVPIGHPGAPHNMHGPPHSMPSMPSAPSGPNTLSTNQSNKGASSVVSAQTIQFCDFSLSENEKN